MSIKDWHDMMAFTVHLSYSEMEHLDSIEMKSVLLVRLEHVYKELSHRLGLEDGTYDLSRELRTKEK